MAKVLGVGGVFVKSPDPAALRAWYARVLDFDILDWGGAVFSPDAMASKAGAGVVWSAFDADTNYFAPSTADVMINFVVDDLDDMLERCRREGVEPEQILPDEPNGRFAHIMDPDGVKIELWEPKPIGA